VDGLLRVTVPVKQPEVYNIDIKVDWVYLVFAWAPETFFIVK
jgi:hypothetical protein